MTEFPQNFPEVFNMVLWVGRVNKDIVKKDYANLSRYSLRRSFIINMNYAGALLTPKGITKHSCNPHCILNRFMNVF